MGRKKRDSEYIRPNQIARNIFTFAVVYRSRLLMVIVYFVLLTVYSAVILLVYAVFE